jgi:signal transduction histidine kinase
MDPVASPSVLASAALDLVASGSTRTALVDRFAQRGATISEQAAGELLDELSALGLLRVSRGNGPDPLFVPTSLAQRANGLGRAVGGEQAQLLRDLETLRTDFLSTLAHELRTPLTVVRTSVGLLRDNSGALSAEQRESVLATIDRHAQRMQRLVADTLDLTRFREGRIALQLRRFDAVELARSVVASFPPRPGDVIVNAPSEPVSLFGDRARLEHALVNLVSNARNYSPASAAIEVTVSSDGESVAWTVCDQGPGIPDDDRQRLFERFFVGRGDRSAAGEGVGLGLPIALAIVQAHGGTITVESQLGQGSCFGIVVPADGPERDDE